MFIVSYGIRDGRLYSDHLYFPPEEENNFFKSNEKLRIIDGVIYGGGETEDQANKVIIDYIVGSGEALPIIKLLKANIIQLMDGMKNVNNE